MRTQTERILALGRALTELGLDSPADVVRLLRAERALHRWHEAHCNGDVCEQDAGGWVDRNGRPVRDAGAAARRQVERVLGQSGLAYYVQTDPRGCALYILRRADVRDGDFGRSYHRGVAVCV